MFCPECGMEIQVYDRSCPKCGKNVKGYTENISKKYHPSGLSIFIGIAIILGIYVIPLFGDTTLAGAQNYCFIASCSILIIELFYCSWLIGIGLIIYGALRRE
jgi:hypothetical protein